MTQVISGHAPAKTTELQTQERSWHFPVTNVSQYHLPRPQGDVKLCKEHIAVDLTYVDRKVSETF